MEIEKFFDEIIAFFSANANEEQVVKYSRYFKEGYDAYGVPQDIFMNKKTEWLKEYKNELSMDNIKTLGNRLFATGKYECGSLAILFLSSKKKEFTPEIMNYIGGWLEKYVSNWAHTDYICSELIGYFYKNKIVAHTFYSEWRNSESRWVRRAVPVGMLALLKISDDYSSLLDFIRPMMHDKERCVHQGLGWFLREAWKLHPEQIEPFLMEFKETAPRLIYQYATEKMTKNKKEEFRQEKRKKA